MSATSRTWILTTSSTRIQKKIVHQTAILSKGKCSANIDTAKACSDAVTAIVPLAGSKTIDDPKQPAGCTMTPDSSAKKFTAVFNKATASSQTCGDGSASTWSGAWEGPVAGAQIDCASGHCLKPDKAYGCTGALAGQCTWDSASAAEEGCGKYLECVAFMCGSHFVPGGNLTCFGRSHSDSHASGDKSVVAYKKVMKPTAAASLAGASPATSSSLVNLTVAHDGVNAR
jgi:hypothetical protein